MILSIVLKSLKESIKPRRFLPFFLLYFIFCLSVLIFALPILSVIPSMLSLQFTNAQIAIAMVNILGLMIVFAMVVLLNLWFSGALVYSLYKNKKFNASLQYSQKLFWQMFALSLTLLIFTGFTYLVKVFGTFLQAIVDIVFMFSLPILIIKRSNFKVALVKSYNIVRKNLLRTFLFWVIMHIVNLAIIILGIFFITLSSVTLLMNIMTLLPMMTELTTVTAVEVTQIVNLIVASYPTLILIAAIGSFFMSLSHVFRYASRTFYFLKAKK